MGSNPTRGTPRLIDSYAEAIGIVAKMEQVLARKVTTRNRNGCVAQRLAHLLDTQKVAGSNPVTPTPC